MTAHRTARALQAALLQGTSLLDPVCGLRKTFWPSVRVRWLRLHSAHPIKRAHLVVLLYLSGYCLKGRKSAASALRADWSHALALTEIILKFERPLACKALHDFIAHDSGRLVSD